MKDNPYSKMIEIIKDKGSAYNPPSIEIGILISPSPNVVIKVNDLQLDRDNLLTSDILNFTTLDIGSRYALIPVYDKQLYIILARLSEVS